MGRPTPTLDITPEQRKALEAVTRQPTAAQRDHRRAAIVLRRADGLSQTATARDLGVSRPSVVKWEKRFREAGVAGLADAPGRGRKPSIAPEVRERIIVGATQPPPNRTRWSVRSMAREAGVSKDTVQRLWSANDMRPHPMRAFKVERSALRGEVAAMHTAVPARVVAAATIRDRVPRLRRRPDPGLSNPVDRPRAPPDLRVKAHLGAARIGWA